MVNRKGQGGPHHVYEHTLSRRGFAMPVACIHSVRRPRNPSILGRRIRDVSGLFLFHFLRENFYKVALEGGAKSTVDSLRRPLFTNFPVALPSADEQHSIVEFVGRESTKIDKLVEEQRRLLELLKEKRQSVISHAVTQGLNPDAPLKPSGIEWLGDVPAHWEVGPVKRFFISLDGRRIPLSSEERSYRGGEYPYYGASGIIDYIDAFIFDEELVLVSEDGANLLNRSTPIAFVAVGQYWVNNHAHILKPPDSNVRFWAERLEMMDLTPFITGSAQPKLTIESLNNLKIAVPPTEAERTAIQDFIIAETAKLDALAAEAQHAIDLLQERRTALISAATTGQIDVRQIAQKEAA
jgi:type I restriction enzyme S subunit